MTSPLSAITRSDGCRQDVLSPGLQPMPPGDPGSVPPLTGRAFALSCCGLALLVCLAFPFLSERTCEAAHVPVVILANMLLGAHTVLFWRCARQGPMGSLCMVAPTCFFATHFSYQTALIAGLVNYSDYTENRGLFFHEATVLALAGFLLLLGGVHVGFATARPRGFACRHEAVEEPINAAAGVACVLSFAVLAEEVLRIGPGTIFGSSYNDPDLWDRFSRVYDASQLFLMLSFLLFSASMNAGTARWPNAPPVLAAATWLGYNAVLGYRGHILIFALAVNAVLAARGYRLNRWIGASLLVSAVASLPVLVAVRGDPVRDRDYRSAVQEHLLTSESLDEVIGTAGQMITTVARALELYPHVLPYQCGATYLQSALYALPNIGGEKGRGGMRSFGQQMSDYYFSGVRAEGGGRKGVGSTPLAEAYGNFSIYGCAMLFCIGWFVGRLEFRVLWRADTFWAYFYGIAYYLVVWTMRNDCSTWARTLTWGWLLFLGIQVWCATVRRA